MSVAGDRVICGAYAWQYRTARDMRNGVPIYGSSMDAWWTGICGHVGTPCPVHCTRACTCLTKEAPLMA